jgi:hypothetical protein
MVYLTSYANINCVISCCFLRVSLARDSTLFFLHYDLSSLVYPEWAVFHEHVQWMFITGLSVGLAVDCLIAGTLSYYLLKNRDATTRSWVSISALLPGDLLSRGHSTRNIVNILLWYTINTTAILT